jgi:hypothetical protein
MYAGVPRMAPVVVWWTSSSSRLARPKSVILREAVSSGEASESVVASGSPWTDSRMLAGFRSR